MMQKTLKNARRQLERIMTDSIEFEDTDGNTTQIKCVITSTSRPAVYEVQIPYDSGVKVGWLATKNETRYRVEAVDDLATHRLSDTCRVVLVRPSGQ